jgi:23S rRNA (uracil1939-C5)-methyltransferase
VTDLIDVEIESLDAAGDGVARHQRRLLTVPFTIPGERVRVRPGPTRPGANAAVLVAVLEPSPHRVRAACAHFGPAAEGGQTCGGCSWQHIAYPEQLRLKADLVTRLVQAVVPSAPRAHVMLPTTATNTPWGYRSKVHFVVHSGKREGKLVMGHYARQSRRVVPVRECPVHDERGNALAFELRDVCERAGVTSLRSIAVRVGCTTSETMATLVASTDTDKRLRVASRRALARPGAPTSLHVNIHTRDDAFVFGKETRHVGGPERLREDVGGVSFLVSPTAFFQTNVRAAEILVQQVLAAVPKGATVLDLYAGAGLFALPLARMGHEVVAIERHPGAVADGMASMRLSRLPPERCRFITRSVEAAARAIGRKLPAADSVILDPPREGCEASVLNGVFRGRSPATAVYVSCDPTSLARDLGRITSHGYQVHSMQPVDMFPHTPHVETVVVLERRR